MISVSEAALRLGLGECTLYSNREPYRRFFTPSTEGKRAMFDIEGYEEYVDTREELVEKTRLFTEYLRHELKIRYSYVAKLAGTSVQLISRCRYEFDVAYRIMKEIKKQHPDWIEQFDDFYGWKTIIKEM